MTAVISNLLLLMKSTKATDLFLMDLMFIRHSVERFFPNIFWIFSFITPLLLVAGVWNVYSTYRKS